MDTHNKLIERALEAIGEVYSDTAVSQEDTARSLQSLIDEIRVLMDTLD